MKKTMKKSPMKKISEYGGLEMYASKKAEKSMRRWKAKKWK